MLHDKPPYTGEIEGGNMEGNKGGGEGRMRGCNWCVMSFTLAVVTDMCNYLCVNTLLSSLCAVIPG